MKRTGISLRRYIAAALLLLQSAAVAQSLTLSQLHDQVLMHEMISGWFMQCTNHGNANITASGEFIFIPDKRIELNFYRPNRYSLKFFRNGTQSRTVSGIEQKEPRYSPVGSLFFSIMNMKKSSLTKRFEIDLSGTIERFTMSLAPKKRMAKILRLVEITGVDGLMDTLRMTTRDNRTVSILLFPEEQPAETICE